MEPNPSQVSPWYLRNINQALALDNATGEVYMRTGITGDVIINGPVTIPGTVTVNSSPEDPVHVHLDEVGTSGILTTPNLPISIQDSAGNENSNSYPVYVSGNVNATISGTPTVAFQPAQTDAFGRLRVSNPQTLFDSQAMYYDHNEFAKYTNGTASITYNANSSTFALTVGTGNGDSAIAETYKVFPYQPGKSLLIYATFSMNTAKANLRQRVGYFSVENGIYFENNGGTLNMVIRSKSSGAVVEDRIPQSSWNGDRLNGLGGANNPSGITLNTALDQIFWIDVEWLGVGSVRTGFIINGNYIICHTFHHANTPSTPGVTDNTTTYMTTANQPIRYEITNTAVTDTGSTMNQICSSVISEGGYAINGLPKSIGHPLASPVILPNDGSFKPLIAIRLNSSYSNAIVLPTFFSIAPLSQSNFQYRIYSRAITTGGSWVNADSGGFTSPVQYNLSPAAVSSGVIVTDGYIIASNQNSASSSQVPFGFAVQLKRDSFTGVMYEYVITACTDGTNQEICASIEWQEIT